MEIHRDRYLRRLISKKDNGLVKVITGLRRCGKTYLLRNLYQSWLIEEGVRKENIIYLALDANINASLRNPCNLDRYLRERISETEGRCYVMIDEIQYCASVPNEALPESVRSAENDITFYDTVLGLMDECDLYITGSNSHMLSTDILTNFRGRGDEVRVYPFSYSEFLSAWPGNPRNALREYLYHGGMPLVLAYPDEQEKAAYLRNLFAKTYESDLVGRHHLRSSEDFGAVLDFLASSMGSFINPTKIAARFQAEHIAEMSRNTVADYIGYLEDAFLIQEAKRFDIRGKEYISGQQKYYFADLGLRNARLDFRQFDRSRLLENAVYNELVMRGCSVDVGRIQMRTRDVAGNQKVKSLEADFIVHDFDQQMYIQVAEGLDDPGKKEQEMASLLHIRDSFPKYLLIDQDIPAHYTEQGIRIMSVEDFLLGKR